MSPKLSPPSIGDVLAGQGNAVDSRYHLSAAVRRQLNKVFPTHWSFLLGEIAMYSFIVLLFTGVYLTLFFDPSMQEVTYNGVYQPLRGVEMSKAFASALDISFEVRGGLFVRQVHHWAALMFSASIMVHLARIFFTGAFRRPREANWVIGSLLLILSMFEGYFGYSLPDDLLSGIGLRAALSSITLGMPVIGTWLHWALFGGDFPGRCRKRRAAAGYIIPRLYVLHILLLPGIILALIGAHLALVWYQKHTQFPGPGRTEHNVVGVRMMPVFAVKSGAFFAMTTGILGLDGRAAADQPDLATRPVQAVSGVGGLAAGLLHDVDRRPGPYLPGLGVLLRPPHHSRHGLGRDDHGPGLHAAARLAVHRAAVDRRQGPPQPVAASARRAGAHSDRRDGDRVLHGADLSAR